MVMVQVRILGAKKPADRPEKQNNMTVDKLTEIGFFPLVVSSLLPGGSKDAIVGPGEEQRITEKIHFVAESRVDTPQ
jgi:hypothetical protein